MKLLYYKLSFIASHIQAIIQRQKVENILINK